MAPADNNGSWVLFEPTEKSALKATGMLAAIAPPFVLVASATNAITESFDIRYHSIKLKMTAKTLWLRLRTEEREPVTEWDRFIGLICRANQRRDALAKNVECVTSVIGDVSPRNDFATVSSDVRVEAGRKWIFFKIHQRGIFECEHF